MLEVIFDVIQQLWLNLQQGQLPDLGGWNYMLMAALMMIQGRTSAVIGGIAAATGYLNLGLIILVAVFSRLMVDLLWYRVGRSGIIGKIGRRSARFSAYNDRVNKGIQGHPAKLMLLSKTTGGMAVPATIAVGSASIPLRRWLPASVAGELLWMLPLLLTGFFATDLLGEIRGGLAYLTTASIVLMLIVAVLMKAKAFFLAKRKSS